MKISCFEVVAAAGRAHHGEVVSFGSSSCIQEVKSETIENSSLDVAM